MTYLPLANIRDIVDLWSEAIALEAHGHPSCAELHFCWFEKSLLGKNEEVPSDKLVEGE